jgi:predicted 3-demethylubiquinone-9 3-methyltransferase (glyoxalase superfamily)
MARSISPFLMFEGDAEAAMTLYASVFGDATILEIERYGAAGPGREGSVKLARFRLCGREILCSDSPVKHAFTFTPSISMFVDCENEAEQERCFAELSDGGKIFMPLDNYGFSRRFGWVGDRFGVSWQLNLPA